MSHPTRTDAPPILRETLPNGLTVFLKEDHAAPVVSSYIFYRVGSRNEVTGYTGLSHWVEHLLFDGSPAFPKGAVHREVAANGGNRNAFTWHDGTAYFETLPAGKLDLAFRIESDRMVNALLDPKEVERERTVIISERQGSENYPGYHLYEETMAAAFKVHPYGHPVIGWKSDLEHISREDLYAHYQRFYHPANATIIVAGDFEAGSALEAIEHYFGSIPSGQPSRTVKTVEPAQEGEHRVWVRRPGGVSYLFAAYHIPEAAHPDIPALTVADAILSGGKGLGRGGGGLGRSSRLRRTLVESGLCSSASASAGIEIDPSLFSLSATMRPGVLAPEVEVILFDQVSSLAGQPVSDEELNSAIEQSAAQLVYAAEGAGRQASAIGRSFLVGLPVDDTELVARLRSVTSADVLRVCQEYLRPDNRTVGVFVPSEERPRSVSSPTISQSAISMPSGVPAEAVRASRVASRNIHRTVLSNGIVVLIHESQGAPWLTLSMSFPGGSASDPDDARGLASATAALRVRGSSRRDYEQLATFTDQRGIVIGGGAGEHFSELSVKMLLDHVDDGIALLAELFLEASFPDAHVQAVLSPLIAAAKEQATNTRAVAERRFRELAYPAAHPFHRWPLGTPEEVAAIGRGHIFSFSNQHSGMGGVVIAASGGLATDDLLDKLERAFGGWAAQHAAPSIAIPDVAPLPSSVRDTVQVPGKTQTDLVIGHAGIRRSNPDYFALTVANTALGILGMGGRIGEQIRERRGLAYYASMSFDAGYGPGPWAARIGVSPKDVDEAVAATVTELRAFLADGPTELEIADSKSLQTGNFALRLETSGGMLSMMHTIERHQLGLDYIERAPERINQVSRSEALEAARANLHPEGVAVVAAGPAPSVATPDVSHS